MDYWTEFIVVVWYLADTGQSRSDSVGVYCEAI